FSASGLPAGLSIDSSSGLVSGTPTTLGTSNVTITVNDGNGGSDSINFSWTINDDGGVTCGFMDQEAEDATLSGAFTVISDAVASNGQYIEVPSGNGVGAVGDPNRAEFCFDVPADGTYKLLGSVWAPNNGANSFFVTVDGQPVNGYKWTIPVNTGFTSVALNNLSVDIELPLTAGEHTVIVYLREPSTRLDTLTMVLATASNQAPVLDPISTQSIAEGDTLIFTANASDNDIPAQTLTYSMVDGPVGASIDSVSGQFSWLASGVGVYSPTIIVSDGALTDSQTVQITVEDASSSCGPLVQEAEAGTLSGAFTVMSDATASNGQYIEAPDGTGVGAVGGVDNAEFCFTVTEAGTYRLVGSVWAPNGGSNSFYVTVDGEPVDGYKWTIPPNTGFTAVNVNDSPVEVELLLTAGNHTVIVYLREDGTRLDTLSLIEVTTANQAPTAVDPGNQNSLINNPVNVVINATDPDNDPLTFSASGLPAGLSIDSSSGLVSGTPTTLGTSNVTITVDDGNGGSDSINFSWTINDDGGVTCGFMDQEAEDATLSGAFTVISDAVANNGQYIEVPSGNGVGAVGGPNRAEFCFDVPADGTYKLLGSVWAPNGGSNSFFVTVDGQPVDGYKWTIPINTGFTDVALNNSSVDIELSLTAGEHTVIVYLREPGTRLDTLSLVEVISTRIDPSHPYTVFLPMIQK
ncbi:MAG: putative Ig domain-containing protein, partial [Chloroflexota bacterium]